MVQVSPFDSNQHKNKWYRASETSSEVHNENYTTN